MWKKVDEAAKKDLPRTAIGHLQAIADKATKEKNYGQMLKAEWQTMMTWKEISRDSLMPQMSRMERQAEAYAKTDPALAAVCYAALAKTCNENRWAIDDYADLASAYGRKAKANPAALAQRKTDDYVPFAVKGRDAAIFGNDLLSLVGFTVNAYKEMHDYYATTQNRAATLLTALYQARAEGEKSGDSYVRRMEGSSYLATLDSLIRLYGDLPACGDVAYERYMFMQRCNVPVKELVTYANDAIARWGTWPRIEALRNEVKELENPRFHVETERQAYIPDTPFMAKVRLTNIGRLTFTLTRLDVDGTESGDPNNDKIYRRLKAKAIKGTEQTVTRTYSGHAAYEEVEDSVVLGGLSAGVYLLEVTPDKKGVDPGRRLVYVSGVYFVHQALPGGKRRVAVLDAKTGQPLPGAKVTYTSYGAHKKSGNAPKGTTVTCGADGEVLIDFGTGNIESMRAYTSADNYLPHFQAWNNFSFYEPDDDGDNISLYTDRKIYRPGQTVRVAGIMRRISGDSQKAAGGRSVTLVLKDANNKTVAEKTLVTDDFGTLSTDFVLPKGGLTGSFAIRVNNVSGGYASFRVEEYKRPAFYVEFDKVTEKYENGDTLTVTGRAKSYAGVPVQGATVEYSVDRDVALWWRYGFYGAYSGGADDGNLAEGETTTDAQGEFKIKMPIVLPKWEDTGDDGGNDVDYRVPRFYNFTVKADVTDQAGETHNGELTLPLGTKPTAFGCQRR